MIVARPRGCLGGCIASQESDDNLGKEHMTEQMSLTV